MYEAMAKKQATTIRRNARQYRDSQEYRVGDKVFFLAPSSDRGAKKKMGKHWRGPYLVVEKCAEVLYKIQPIPEGEKDAMVVHVGRLKPYFPPIDLEDDPSSPPPYFKKMEMTMGEASQSKS